MHVILHASVSGWGRFSSQFLGPTSSSGGSEAMPKSTLTWLLKSFRTSISGTKRHHSNNSVWEYYEHENTYQRSETDSKREFVAQYVRRKQPIELLDLGCNTGSYTELALMEGIDRAIGIDFDVAAIERGVTRADDGKLNLLPLVIDAMNPSPSQGWGQSEWLGFKDRFTVEGLLALAFVHHIVIGRNVPIERAVEWIVSFAPSGVIEFVPKSDPMVQRMLANRVDIFLTYDIATFRRELSLHAAIIAELVLPNSGRTLFEFQR